MKQKPSEKRSFTEQFCRFFTSKKAMLFSGIVCAIPFVFPYAAALSWVGYVPFALVFLNIGKAERARAVFPKAFLFGLSFYTVGYSWLCELYPMDFIGFDRTESLLVILLAITAVPSLHALILAACATVCKAVAGKASAPVTALAFPCAILFTEYLQSLGALAFPWCRVFVSQAAFPVLLQSASLFGSYGLTALVLTVNLLIAYAWIAPKRRRIFLGAALSLFSVNLLFGAVRMNLSERRFVREDTPRFDAVVLQGNIPSDRKWNGNVGDMFTRYLALCDQALGQFGDNESASGETRGTLVLTPETALPVSIDAHSGYAEILSRYAEENEASLAVGAFAKLSAGSGNSIFVFTPDGEISEPYTKRHLVPFGEYLPYRAFFERFLPALAEINVLSEDQAAGTDAVLFDSPVGKIGSLICYESIFPELARENVRAGAEILLIATNDSWFGSSGALRHHLAQAQMRAIENNVPVLRAANTGISALIAPDGRIVRSLGANLTGTLSASLPYGAGATLYSVLGDIILFAAAAFLVLARAAAWRSSRRAA